MEFLIFIIIKIHQRRNLQFGYWANSARFALFNRNTPNDIDVNNIDCQLNWMKSTMFQNCFAIGECGLDSLVPIDQKIQEDVFVKQINIANEVKKPIIVHCVRKFYEVISFKKKGGAANDYAWF